MEELYEVDQKIRKEWNKLIKEDEGYMKPTRRLALDGGKVFVVSRDRMDEEYETDKGLRGMVSTIVFLCRQEESNFKVYAIPRKYLGVHTDDDFKYYTVDRRDKLSFIDSVKISTKKKNFYSEYEEFTYNSIIKKYRHKLKL
jgi:hypothetical protein